MKRRAGDNPVHADLIAVAKNRNISDRGFNSTGNSYRLPRRYCRKHARPIERSYELASLSFPKHSNGINLVR